MTTGIIVAGKQSEAVNQPSAVLNHVVEVRGDWSAGWMTAQSLQALSMSRACAGADLDTLQLLRKYGNVKQPWEAALILRPSAGRLLDRAWVRVSFATDEGLVTAFVGRVSGEARDLFGSDEGRAGLEHYTAYGPLQLLMKCPVSRSWWWDSAASAERDIGWAPGFNVRDEQGVQVGNRTADAHPVPHGEGKCHLFGGTSIWNRRQMCEYLLARFADQGGTTGPAWKLGGQAKILEAATDSLPVPAGSTVASLLEEIISPRLGLGWKIEPTSNGFEVQVFSLLGEEESFGGATIPRNPNAWRIIAGQFTENLRCNVVRTCDHVYDKVRVIGRRVVVCCSLAGENAKAATLADGQPRLDKVWSSDLEYEYAAGHPAGGLDPRPHDHFRTRDRFADVYRSFMASADWNFQSEQAAPHLQPDGVYLGVETDRQSAVRSTLPWLPLLSGFDYSQIPTADLNDGEAVPELVPPQAWVYDPTQGKYLPCGLEGSEGSEGISVMAARQFLGAHVCASPPHLLAKDRPFWASASPSRRAPLFDWTHMVVTLAFEFDQRLQLTMEQSRPTGDGSCKDIEVPDAEYWFLAPRTMVGVASDGSPATSGSVARVLRDDTARLRLVMAGAAARYLKPRCRAEVVLAGVKAAGGMLGNILSCVEDKGDTESIQAPITSIHWQLDGTPSTTIKTGYGR
jgi:hypothetical protein